ncbi:MAG: shikimate dehydrogenase [Hydrogenovibrio sp.]|uniref:shikimate dehydrogenase n=1 Tax=Hydrogenovibrio sp. TaxID=2065821 RepID=UPI002870AE56|nr:shikimate dehydrogenase [Hydrogenovibrio sp.]MDR9498317.1 shikimate dehydrogenase [Hydrogenovibrio sp.]
MSQQPDKYAVVGDPIAHSKSPQIHAMFAEQTGQNLIYEAIRIDTEDDNFARRVQSLRQQGYKGLNVTVPFKLDAFELAQDLSERARTAHAVNTLVLDEPLFGDNTDGVGLVSDIETNAGVAFAGKRVLILGAGGAVQGILQPLLQKQPGLVHIANRTAKRADVLGQRFETDVPLSASGWEDIPVDRPYDIVINGTSASLEGKRPPVSEQIIGPQSLVYDMMYQNEPTVFMQWAHQHQPECQTRDGLGMLVGQAAESFALWRGVHPQTQPVIAALRAQM